MRNTAKIDCLRSYMHYCECKGTTKLQLLQRVFLRMLTEEGRCMRYTEVSWIRENSGSDDVGVT